MTTQTIDLQIDDYLDLYLYAKQLRDVAWQAEIEKRLAECSQRSQLPKADGGKELQEQFRAVNRQILQLYRSLHTGQRILTDDLSAVLFALKHRRVELGKEIDRLRIQNQRICK